jgi:hypothetical protein
MTRTKKIETLVEKGEEDPEILKAVVAKLKDNLKEILRSGERHGVIPQHCGRIQAALRTLAEMNEITLDEQITELQSLKRILAREIDNVDPAASSQVAGVLERVIVEVDDLRSKRPKGTQVDALIERGQSATGLRVPSNGRR